MSSDAQTKFFTSRIVSARMVSESYGFLVMRPRMNSSCVGALERRRGNDAGASSSGSAGSAKRASAVSAAPAGTVKSASFLSFDGSVSSPATRRSARTAASTTAASPCSPPENATRSTSDASDAAATAVSGVRARTSDAAANDASNASRAAFVFASRGNAESNASANRASRVLKDLGSSGRWSSKSRVPEGSAPNANEPNSAPVSTASRQTLPDVRLDAASRTATVRSTRRANVAPASGPGASITPPTSADRSEAVSRAMRSSARRTNPRAPRNRAATGSTPSSSRRGVERFSARGARNAASASSSRSRSNPPSGAAAASSRIASRLSRRSKKARDWPSRASSVSNARTSAPSAAKRARAESAASRRSSSAASERRLGDPRESASRMAHAPAPRIAARSSSSFDETCGPPSFLRRARSRQRRARLAAEGGSGGSSPASADPFGTVSGKREPTPTGANAASVARADASLRSGGAKDASRNWRTAGRSRVSHSVTSSSPPASTARRARSNTRARSISDAAAAASGTVGEHVLFELEEDMPAVSAADARRVTARHASPSARRASG